MLRTDFLPRICAASVVNDVFSNGRKAFEVGVAADDVPTMPIEFSVAAFRLGHSMVRPAYNWNQIFDDGFRQPRFLFRSPRCSGNLGGRPRLASTWIADFRRLYDFGRRDAPISRARAKFNRAMRIDTRLSTPLSDLPGFPRRESNLAFRNLRGAAW